MTTVKLYWNHICVLHRQELIFLNTMKENLKEEDIDLEITCFGLGYECHMSDYLRRPDAVLPDIIVSADLEVFEDRRIFDRFGSLLHPVADWYPLKDTEHVPLLKRNAALLPFMAIPLVFYADKAKCPDPGNLTLMDAVNSSLSFSFGGINNSAAKTAVKTVWEHHGADAAVRLLSASYVTDMPIQAFSRVRTGQSDLALVPSIYALRADGVTHDVFCPADGAVAIPSYICARNTLTETVAKTVISHLTTPEISNFYVQNGNLISCLKDTPENMWLKEQNVPLQVPSWTFLQTLDPADFYQLYQELQFTGKPANCNADRHLESPLVMDGLLSDQNLHPPSQSASD